MDELTPAAAYILFTLFTVAITFVYCWVCGRDESGCVQYEVLGAVIGISFLWPFIWVLAIISIISLPWKSDD